jgi:glycerol-3-phosphate dehydrogenase
MEPSLSAPDVETAPSYEHAVDVLVVGGGINGVGIARDLAGRGLRVMLCEKDDLAQHTSSSSTKLIHGGLRYLEHYEFGLVRKALQEREVLLRSAPHLIWPLRFVMPHHPGLRPAWMIRAGLFLYDHLARREILPASWGLNLRQHPAGEPLKPEFGRGFEYSDAWVDDARLVVLNAVDAAERGAQIRPRCEVLGARAVPARPEWGEPAQGKVWEVRCRPAHVGSMGDGHIGGEDAPSHEAPEFTVRARALVNAAGPWAASLLGALRRPDPADPGTAPGRPAQRQLRLVKGSHIVLRRLFTHEHPYIFQNSDGRILFAIPYEQHFTLVGTTDVEYHGSLDAVQIEADEVRYLCEQASRYFRQPLRPEDVVWTYAGVRPLLEDEHGNPAAVTRDYRLEMHAGPGPALLSVWGGKLTTYRRLAEEAADVLCAHLGAAGGTARQGAALMRGWTAHTRLPGGDLAEVLGERTPASPVQAFEAFVAELVGRHPHLPRALLHRWARAYGTRVLRWGERLDAQTLGAEVAPGLYECELQHWMQQEWARTSEDALWRRSKLGLHLSAPSQRAVGDGMKAALSMRSGNRRPQWE